MVSGKLKICFDSGQFVGGAKNLRDQCAAVIYRPKSLSKKLTLLVNFGVTPQTAQKFMPFLK